MNCQCPSLHRIVLIVWQAYLFLTFVIGMVHEPMRCGCHLERFMINDVCQGFQGVA